MITNQITKPKFRSLTWSLVNSQPHNKYSSNNLSLVNQRNLKGLGSYGFARHYSRNRYLLSFPRPTKMFQFRRFPFNYPIYSGSDAHDMTHGGFPHSDIPGSKLVDSSPRLFAVFHVLHRLYTSRHPLCALEYLFMH